MPQIPFAFQWKIPEDQLIALKNSVDGKLCSSWVSNIPGFKYGLSIYPNGNKEKYRGKTRISLHLELGNVKKVEADFAISIESAGFLSQFDYNFDKSCGWGLSFTNTKEFFDHEKKYIVNGQCTVKAEGIFKFETEKDAEEKQKWEGGEIGDRLWKNDDKDCTIVVGGNEIKVHKLILRSRSEVFKAMFKPETKESTMVPFPYFFLNNLGFDEKNIRVASFGSSVLVKILFLPSKKCTLNKFKKKSREQKRHYFSFAVQNSRREYFFSSNPRFFRKRNHSESIENKVEIEDFPFNIVEAGIKLMYHCKFVTTLSINDMMKLLQFFDKYQIPSLKEEVETRLISKISAANVCKLANSSILSNSTKLKNACMEFLETAIISKTALYDFDSLDSDIICEVVKNSLYQNVETG